MFHMYIRVDNSLDIRRLFKSLLLPFLYYYFTLCVHRFSEYLMEHLDDM